MSSKTKKIKVLNIARFQTIQGLKRENDIYMKIYYNLKNRYDIDSLFIKPVTKLPAFYFLLKPGSKYLKDLFDSDEYVDDDYKIPVKFFEDSFFLFKRLGFDGHLIRKFQYFFLGYQLRNEIAAYKPDLIHSHSIYPDGYYALKVNQEFKIPYILTLRGSYSDQYKSNVYRRILDHASHVHTPSYSLYEKLCQDYQLELIPHPLDTTWFDAPTDKKNDKLRLITVSRLLEMKNIDVVLKAVKNLIEDGIRLKYLIVGDGSYRSELECLADKLEIRDFVSFKGHSSVDEMKQYYRESNVFVLLSRPETYGRAYFEAAAQGMVVIGAEGTGAYGHLTSQDGFFIKENEYELTRLLKEIAVKSLYENNRVSKDKIEKFKEKNITSRYYHIIKNSV